MEEIEETTPVQEEPAEMGAASTDAQVAAEEQTTNVWQTVGIILAVLAVVLVGSAVFYGLATHPSFTAVLRDISIIVLALVTMITSLLLAVLLFQLQSLIVLLRDEIQPILQSINETTGTVRGTTTFVSDAVVTPVIQVAGYVAGVRTTLRTLFGGRSKQSTSPETVQHESQPPAKAPSLLSLLSRRRGQTISSSGMPELAPGKRKSNQLRKELKRMADKSYGADFFAGFVVGALVGAAAAILFAPQSGEETRAMIRERSIELQERSAEMSEEARKRAMEYEAQAKERAAGLQSRMQEAVDQGKAAAGQQKEDLMTGIQEQEPIEDAPAET